LVIKLFVYCAKLLTFKSKTMKNELKHSLIYFAIGCAFILGFVLGVISKVQVTCL